MCAYAATQSYQTLRLRDCSLPSPLSLGLFRQEYWSGLSFPPSSYFPNPGVKPISPASLLHCSRVFTTVPTGKPTHVIIDDKYKLPHFFLKLNNDFSRLLDNYVVLSILFQRSSGKHGEELGK